MEHTDSSKTMFKITQEVNVKVCSYPVLGTAQSALHFTTLAYQFIQLTAGLLWEAIIQPSELDMWANNKITKWAKL